MIVYEIQLPYAIPDKIQSETKLSPKTKSDNFLDNFFSNKKNCLQRNLFFFSNIFFPKKFFSDKKNFVLGKQFSF